MGQPSHLFRNEGGRKFRDVTKEAGLAMPPAETKTLSIAVLDYDGDGRPDLYFVNDRVSNRLFRNRGDGRFEEVTAETGAGVLGERPRAGMGVAVGDPFGSGRDSLFVTNFGAEENSLYRNVDGVLFEDAGKTSGVAAARHAVRALGNALRRLRQRRLARPLRRGRAPGAPSRAGARPLPQRRGALRRRGRSQLRAAHGPAPQPRRWTLRRVEGRGRLRARPDGGARDRPSPICDGDGALDLVVVDVDGSVRLFRNDAAGGASWIAIEPRPGADGRTVLETRVRVTAGGRTQTQTYRVSPSYASGSLVPLHFGLGAAEKADEVEVRWPGGRDADLPGRRGADDLRRAPAESWDAQPLIARPLTPGRPDL